MMAGSVKGTASFTGLRLPTVRSRSTLKIVASSAFSGAPTAPKQRPLMLKIDQSIGRSFSPATWLAPVLVG